MSDLSKNWVVEGLIDFEYKKYMLLAYLKRVNACFYNKALYPTLADLIAHYKNLKALKDQKSLLKENFPKRLAGADYQKLKLIYEDIIQDSAVMNEIEDILSFSIPKMRQYLEDGKAIYEFLEEQMTIDAVGVTPLSSDAGYLFLAQDGSVSTEVYAYQMTIFSDADAKYRSLSTTHIQTAHRSLSNSYEAIKLSLVKEHKNMPIPATYLVTSKITCPYDETFLPIAKRLLMKHVSTAA